MKLEKSIYPYNPEVQKLPLFLAGIGGSDYQGEVERPQGYHWHQILFCSLGTGKLEIYNQTIHIGKDDAVFLPKDVPHRYYPDDEKWGVSWIAFEGAHCDEVLTKFHMTEPMLVNIGNDLRLGKLFERMVRSQETDFLYCDYICSGLLYEYLIELHRHTNAATDSARSRKISLLLPALRYIQDNYAKDFSMVQLSKILDVTPEYFCRVFKNTMNTTPIAYLTGIRINEAKRFLQQVGNSVLDVARMTGFNDPGYFCTVFKKYVGISPSEYRRQHT